MYNVLIIDDSKLVRWSLKEMMKQDDINVVETESYDQACDCMKTQTFDLIFFDQEMEREKNLMLIEQLKKLQPKSKVILFTTIDNPINAKLFIALDVYSVVHKPFNTQDVKTMVIQALGITSIKNRNDHHDH